MGFLLAVLGGILMGSFSLPMKRTAGWAWENVWLVWSVAALIVTPWVIAFVTVDPLFTVYAKAGMGTLAMVFLFGVGWGLGAMTFGQSISILGMSLAFAISIGLTLAVGSLVPLASRPAVFATSSGIVLSAGIALMLAGVAVSAWAGSLKETRAAAARTGSFAKGLTLCILSGLFNPMLNFASTFSDRIKDAAKACEVSSGGAADAVWAVTLLGGFLSNAVYCGLLLTRNQTWGRYRAAGTGLNGVLAVVMGVTWVGSVAIYGRAVPLLGELGNSAGWAITMGCCIAMSNVWGIASGEWRDAPGKPFRTMIAGLAVILLAIAVIGYGNSLSR
jgi:L-rhamnose-H+ transport protein